MEAKTALVTGASRGIGRAIALELGRLGCSVAVNYRSSTKAAAEVVSRIEADGGTARAFQADIGSVAAIEGMFDEVIEHFGALDIVVNNAGIMVNTPVDQVSEAEFDRVFNLNVKGLFFCCQQAARKLRDNGRIVNIGTTVTRIMLPRYGTYAASKGAVEQLTKVLAKELGGRGITVNSVSPGPTDTELFRQGKSEDQIAGLASMSAFDRIGRPEDIGRVVALLCRPEAAWISGQNVLANGAFAA